MTTPMDDQILLPTSFFLESINGNMILQGGAMFLPQTTILFIRKYGIYTCLK